ncbi:MAG: helicase, partial [Trebonia sp.]
LPASYLSEHKIAERMKVTFSKSLAQRKLDEARQSKKTLWPEIAYLSDLHPMIEWLTDKVLLRVVRQQAPVIIAQVGEPTFLVQGVYSNALGQPTVVEWMAVTGLPDQARVTGMFAAVSAAKVGPKMVNTGHFGDIAMLQSLVPAAVKAARTHLEQRRAEYDSKVDEPINAYRARVRTWEQLSLADVSTSKKEKEVRDTAGDLGRMIDAFHTAGEPLLRVLAVLDRGEH